MLPQAQIEEVIEGVTGVPTRYLGAIDHVRSECGVLLVYSALDSGDLEALVRSPNYVTTDLDVWCWRTHLPEFEIAREDFLGRRFEQTRSPWQLEDFAHRQPRPDYERHVIRVFDRFQKLSEQLFDPSRRDAHALLGSPGVSLEQLATGTLAAYRA